LKDLSCSLFTVGCLLERLVIPSEKFIACRSTPGFPELRKQLEIMTRLQGQGLELFGTLFGSI
jgi:hypothetical protein